ncbi:hypothetical protein FGO68_gene4136 [Halteria grandinella]|uniref:Uncharacterized protein n=1 Tax=Halteria grandinella TaxID=5974 RepID=A0A8J8NYZ0_HALGN|nr:hypothetical protein FGO68_gene4136 [Halteria grandinella]
MSRGNATASGSLAQSQLSSNSYSQKKNNISGMWTGKQAIQRRAIIQQVNSRQNQPQSVNEDLQVSWHQSLSNHILKMRDKNPTEQRPLTMNGLTRGRVNLSQSPVRGNYQRDGNNSPFKASDYGELPIRATPQKEFDRVFTYGRALSSALEPVLSAKKYSNGTRTPKEKDHQTDEAESQPNQEAANKRGSLMSIEQAAEMRSRYYQNELNENGGYRTLGHLEPPTQGFVDLPQYFKNMEGNLSLERQQASSIQRVEMSRFTNNKNFKRQGNQLDESQNAYDMLNLIQGKKMRITSYLDVIRAQQKRREEEEQDNSRINDDIPFSGIQNEHFYPLRVQIRSSQSRGGVIQDSNIPLINEVALNQQSTEGNSPKNQGESSKVLLSRNSRANYSWAIKTINEAVRTQSRENQQELGNKTSLQNHIEKDFKLSLASVDNNSPKRENPPPITGIQFGQVNLMNLTFNNPTHKRPQAGFSQKLRSPTILKHKKIPLPLPIKDPLIKTLVFSNSYLLKSLAWVTGKGSQISPLRVGNGIEKEEYNLPKILIQQRTRTPAQVSQKGNEAIMKVEALKPQRTMRSIGGIVQAQYKSGNETLLQSEQSRSVVALQREQKTKTQDGEDQLLKQNASQSKIISVKDLLDTAQSQQSSAGDLSKKIILTRRFQGYQTVAPAMAVSSQISRE